MNQSDLLGTTFDCECGRRHTVPTRHLFYSEDAFTHLVDTVRSVAGGNDCLVIADTRTWEVAGETVETTLRSGNIRVNRFIVPDVAGESPAADDKTRDLMLAEAPPADILIGVGSGVINDLVKWIAYLRKKPYLIVATAASMNGYASANVAATIDGLKVLFHAEACQAVFATPGMIVHAPYELSTSGLGDVLAKSVSSADWKLNQFLFDDYYCQFSVNLLKDLEPVYLENPTRIRERDPAAFEALFQALFYSSIAMTITGTSSPASGGEHLISHTLDMLALRDNGKHDYHGRQVGVSSILMAALYETVMALEHPVFKPFPETINKAFWGSLSPVIEPEYRKKQPKMAQATAYLSQPDNWARLKALLQPNLVAAQKLKNCLSQAGAGHRYQDIRDNRQPLERDKLLSVVRHANEMRERFTILDLAVMLGIIPGEIEALVDRWITH
ncbi:sn-glycerol-1-phosphate dehydrogenase [bacterium]|nr:sn-glycerol-1-phosphate dehydrogenase [bacterium]